MWVFKSDASNNMKQAVILMMALWCILCVLIGLQISINRSQELRVLPSKHHAKPEVDLKDHLQQQRT